jgi:uncharacterized protein
MREKPRGVSPSVRVIVVFAALLVGAGITYITTGSVLPQDPRGALIFQNGLLLIVLGSSFLETYYTKPADSLVNSLTGVVTLTGVKYVAPSVAWWAILGYCLVVTGLSSICVYASSHAGITGWRRKLATATYKPAVMLGSAKLLFSVLFLFGLFSFYSLQSTQTVLYILFWGLFIVIWPLGLPNLFSSLRRAAPVVVAVGRIVRTDWPGLVRVRIEPQTRWDSSSPKVAIQADGRQCIVVPLYCASQGDDLIGTGLCLNKTTTKVAGVDISCVYDVPALGSYKEEDVAEALGGAKSSRLVGFVVEGSEVAQIRFETWSDLPQQGLLVWCYVGQERVYYQVTNGLTREESFQSNRQGFQEAMASQLGILRESMGFARYPWLPRMNTPVFAQTDLGAEIPEAPGDFVYGMLPGTKLQIGGPFADEMCQHTAILGVTGSGKTELALDMLRYAAGQGNKVICIDLTDRYEGRLADLNPRDLSLPSATCAELSQKLFDAETGAYGAGAEKKALKACADKLRSDVTKSLDEFLKADGEKIGIITLEEISNTKATLYVTELYLTCLLNYARDHPTTFPRTLIVVEEAHTVMPEPGMAGVGDFDTRALVSKITQIALQGRKYRIGLLVVAQRTATVSKSVLTQCNTVISFACYDDTSIQFLSNVFGAEYASLLPNLAPLHAVVYGKAVRSQRPLVVAIPFREEKAMAERMRPDGSSGGNVETIDEGDIPF